MPSALAPSTAARIRRCGIILACRRWPIRWLLVKDLEERFTPQAFLSTDRTLTPQQMLTFFIQRWQVETTFEEARAHLGMETQRQWNDQAIAQTTPLVLALFTIVALLAHTLIGKPICRIRQSAWYSKTKPTFSDALAWVRKHIWRDPPKLLHFGCECFLTAMEEYS